MLSCIKIWIEKKKEGMR